MKPTINSANRSAITVYGTEEFLAWVKAKRPELANMTLEGLNCQPNIYLVATQDANLWGSQFIENYKQIFIEEVTQYMYMGEELPEMNLEIYKSWFTYRFHEMVYDFSSDEYTLYEEGYNL